MKYKPVTVQFVTKPGCHLCDDAIIVLSNALRSLETQGISVQFEELNMLEHEELKKYAEDIPVVLIDGKRHSYWHVDEARFKNQVLKRAKRLF